MRLLRYYFLLVLANGNLFRRNLSTFGQRGVSMLDSVPHFLEWSTVPSSWLASPDSSKMRSVFAVLLLIFVCAVLVESKDMLRKSIVFDKKTPDVFYCPQKKPKGVDKMIVKAKPLKKLCEFEGKPLPPDYKSDCYNDVDETEYACKEKHRIMKRMKKLEHEIEKKETERASRSRRI